MLTPTDHTVLDIATRRYKYAGIRDAAIRDELGVSAVRFAMMLGRLLEDPVAEAERTRDVRRLRRIREQQRMARVAG